MELAQRAGKAFVSLLASIFIMPSRCLTFGCAMPRLSKSSGCLRGSSITCGNKNATGSQAFEKSLGK
eukprot:1160911-Pelagomonas_calceolata.AAC.18